MGGHERIELRVDPARVGAEHGGGIAAPRPVVDEIQHRRPLPVFVLASKGSIFPTPVWVTAISISIAASEYCVNGLFGVRSRAGWLPVTLERGAGERGQQVASEGMAPTAHNPPFEVDRGAVGGNRTEPPAADLA